MKKNRVFCWVVCLIVIVQMTIQPVLATETEASTLTTNPVQTENDYAEGAVDSAVAYGCHSVDAQVPLCGSDKLLETAGAAMLYEVNSDTVMYAWNPDAPVHPASLVKIMTALLALENGNLADVVTVNANAISTLKGNEATLKLQPGEKLTLEQLLSCLMVGSANDAAVVIADHIAGSQQGFIAMMNQRALELGCTGTVFTNPHGLHDNAQITTARDMVKILREAIKNEDFMVFFSDTVYTLPATNMSESRYMETTNYMMTTDITVEYYDRRVTGGRTGVTNTRRRCLIVSAESGDLCYIAIVMDAIATADPEDPKTIKRFGSYEEVGELLDMGFKDFRITQILSDNEIFTQYPVTNGTNGVTVGPSKSISTILPKTVTSKDLTAKYTQSITTLTAPVEEGVQVNVVQLWYGNVCLAQSPLITKNSSRIQKTEQSSNFFEDEGNSMTTVLIIIAVLAGGALAVAGVLFVVRLAHRMSLRAQHRRRRRSRRRSR